MANIKFGTDGWRAVIGKDFTFENVEIVTNSIGKYVFDNFGLSKKILVGYDPRNMAGEFAKKCANWLAEVGFEVLLSDKVVPTPVLAYSAKHLNACAIMFTASHNPPEYLGMKFIPDYAGPATSEITDELMHNLGAKLPENDGEVLLHDFMPDYFEHIKDLIDFEKIKKLETNIIFNGLYSASIGYFDKILDAYGIEYKSINMAHDINFGGGMPEPKPKYMADLIEMVKSEKNSIGLANDGDGDRFGVINEKGEYVSPNEIIAILLLYLKENKKFEGTLVKTVGGSFLLDKTAEKIGVEVVETAVGFKYVGEAMRKYSPIIGGEDSGGLSIKGHIPEKDGILANLLILEVMGSKGKSLVELQDEIHAVAGARFFTDLVNMKLENQEQIKIAIEKAQSLKQVNGFEVIKVDLKDGVKLYLSDNSSWILVRASGTEPLLRIYFESNSVEKLQQLKEKFKLD